MVFKIFILLLTLSSVQLFPRPDINCDHTVRVLNHQMLTITSPHWPNPYRAGTICRWIFDCPDGFSCRIRCRNVGLPKTKKCFMDKLMVSTVGNLQLKGSQVYCGERKINTKSIGTRIVMALVTKEASPGGRFRCKVRPEPYM